MELLSEAFRDAVEKLFDRDNELVATVHVYKHPFTDRLKRSPTTEVVKVTNANRDDLPQNIATRLLAQ
jgi:nucleoside-triphosphatase THEP1